MRYVKVFAEIYEAERSKAKQMSFRSEVSVAVKIKRPDCISVLHTQFLDINTNGKS